MPRVAVRAVCALASVASAVFVLSVVSPQPSGQSAGNGLPSKANGEWAFYNADMRGSRYMPLDQINASNFNKLEVAWRLKTDNLGPRPEYKLEGTPLMVNRTVYATAGTRRAVVALDAKTGELKWVYSMDEGRRGDLAPRKLSGRGLSYWTDGRGDDRIVYVTPGYRLVELNAKTGQPIAAFGKGGLVDLKEGVVYGKLVNGKWQQVQIPLDEGEIGLHSTPLVVNDTVVVQSSMAEGIRYEYSNNAKGLVRAFDVKTGRMLWRWNTMAGPGEPGHETWENGSWNWTGNTGVWTELSADPELGLVYCPVESPTIDTYGGNRPGNNLYDSSLVALDLKTGKMKWYFQQVHHDIWDIDNAGGPVLMDVTIDGKPRKIVGQTSKIGWLYVLDRATGEPVWPIPEKPAPPSDVPGEKAAATQPWPSKPPAFSRGYLAPDQVIDFTPELHAKALENLKKFRWEQTPFVPYVMPTENRLASILVGTAGGGVNWPGSSFDPETGVFYAAAANAGLVLGIITQDYLDIIKPETQEKKNHIPIWESSEALEERIAEQEMVARNAGPGGGGNRPMTGMAAATAAAQRALNDGLNGLPIMKPPYGVLTALDINTGTLKFQVPHGETPDAIRNNPLLRGKDLGRLGQSGVVAPVITKTLVVVGDPQVTAPPGRPRGAMLRAYDKNTGEQVGAVYMPAAQSGDPMTYMVDGRQYIIVAVGGGSYTSEYIAFALPQSEVKKTTQQ